MQDVNLNPHPLVKSALKYFPNGRVLDIGCGSGENSVYLASKGFSVTALDNSAIFVHSTEQLARIHKVSLKVVMRDIREFVFPLKYEVIICTGVLHFLSESEAKEVLKEIMNNTTRGGINIISSFNKYHGRREKKIFDKEELKKIYSDWEILHYFEEGHNVEIVAKKY